MGIYGDHILPRCINLILNTRECPELRGQAARGLFGQVLEVGFGSGLNLPHYPEAVEMIHAVDPALVGRKLAARRLDACPIPVRFADLVDDNLPLATDSVDAVLSTWTLCTIPMIEHTLLEMRRVLKPGGRLHFLEHGLSPDAKVNKWQRRLNPLSKLLGGGCHLDRRIDDLLRAAGFGIDRLRNFYMSGPNVLTYRYGGVAINPA